MLDDCVRIIENINLWEIFTSYNSGRKYAIFLVNSEDDEIPNNQQPLMNVVFCVPSSHRRLRNRIAASVSCAALTETST